jgi:hypothetical protein
VGAGGLTGFEIPSPAGRNQSGRNFYFGTIQSSPRIGHIDVKEHLAIQGDHHAVGRAMVQLQLLQGVAGMLNEDVQRAVSPES